MESRAQLLSRAHSGDRDAVQQMIEENTGLIWSVARRYFGRGVDADDLYQLGCLGFLKAIEGFDERFGTQFSTYAVPKIAGEIRRFLRDDGAVKVSRGLKERAQQIHAARRRLEQTLGREPALSEIAAECGVSVEEIAEAEEEGTAIRCGYGPKEFLTKDGHVCGVVLKRCTGLYDAEGRFAPTYDESVTITLPCDNVVLSIGQCIQWGNLLDGEAVQLGRGQGAVADAMTYQTAQSDIFVGGDVYTGPRFAIDAIAAGKQGAISIHRFVQPNTSLTIGRNCRDFYELDKTNLALGDYDRAPRQAAGMDDAIDAHRSFRDAHLTLTEAQVKTETARCLGCGASVVDPNKCIGCGVCTTKCEFDAIHLHRDLPECSTMVRSEDKFKAILPYMAKREVKIRFGKKDK